MCTKWTVQYLGASNHKKVLITLGLEGAREKQSLAPEMATYRSCGCERRGAAHPGYPGMEGMEEQIPSSCSLLSSDLCGCFPLV